MSNELINKIKAKWQLPEGADVRTAVLSPIIKSDGANDHRITARITTDSVDRQGEVLIPDGMDASEFVKSGAIFWNHDYDNPIAFPVGKILRGDRFVECQADFMKRPDSHVGDWFPDFARAFVSQGVAAGVMPGVSVGFISTRGRRATADDKKRYGEGVEYIHSNWKLLEWSIAPVQANQDAYVVAVGKGLISRDTLKRIGVTIPEPKPQPKKIPTMIYVLPLEVRKPDQRALIKRLIDDEVKRLKWKVYA